MRKKFLIVMVMILIFNFTIISYASTLSLYGGTIVSSRCGFSFEVENSMEKAKETYEAYGYSTNNVIDPSELTFLSNVMGKQIQLHWCHGGYNQFAYDDVGMKTGNTVYNWTVRFPGDNEYTVLPSYGVNYFDWDDKLLVTLACCEVATLDEPDYSISCEISQYGADMVVGWYTLFNNLSGADWIDHYHDWLADDYTVLEAIEYANSKFYLANNVKNNILYHHGSIKNLAGEEWTVLSSMDNISMDTNVVPLNQEIKKSDVENVLTQYDSTFNLQNFEEQEETCSYVKNVDTNEYTKISKYIDYVEKIGDFYTNSAYTVELDESNKVRKIYDNTVDASTIMMLRNDTTTVSDNTKEYYIQKARANIEDTDLIIDEEVKLQWDLNENKKYIYIELIMKEMDVNSTYSYKYELN